MSRPNYRWERVTGARPDEPGGPVSLDADLKMLDAYVIRFVVVVRSL